MSTIKDVSKFSGLSLATISKYLNGGNVRDENRQRIDQAVEALGYRVNRNARSLKTNRTMTVGVVMPTLSVPFFGSVLSSLDQSLRRLGLDYVDIFYSHRFDPQTPLEETISALDHAVRSGSGDGHAFRSGSGNGHATRTGSGIGPAIRDGHGHGEEGHAVLRDGVLQRSVWRHVLGAHGG